MENKKHKSKEQGKSKKTKPKKSEANARTLKIVLIVCFAIIIFILVAYFYINSLRSYTYEGVEFTTVQEGELILYQTSIPVPYEGGMAPYNFYLRTNPKKLQNVPFDNSDFKLMQNTVLNFQDEFDCEGYGIIAIANLVQLHSSMGINIIKDENATCDARYNFMNITLGDKTEIQKIDENCYNIVINDCEILPGTERMMLEMFVKYSEI